MSVYASLNESEAVISALSIILTLQAEDGYKQRAEVLDIAAKLSTSDDTDEMVTVLLLPLMMKGKLNLKFLDEAYFGEWVMQGLKNAFITEGETFEQWLERQTLQVKEAAATLATLDLLPYLQQHFSPQAAVKVGAEVKGNDDPKKTN